MIGDIMTGVASLANVGLNAYSTYRNYQNQKEMLNYNKWFSENQYSIASQDMARAGLSKTLAAGSGAKGISVGSAPQVDTTAIGGINDVLAAIAQKQSIKNAKAENKNIEADTSVKLANAGLALEQAKTQQKQQDYFSSQINRNSFSNMLDLVRAREINQGMFKTWLESEILNMRRQQYQRIGLDPAYAGDSIGAIATKLFGALDSKLNDQWESYVPLQKTDDPSTLLRPQQYENYSYYPNSPVDVMYTQ